MKLADVAYRVSPEISNHELNGLIEASWELPDWEPVDWAPVLAHSLAYVCAYFEGRLIGFVNVAWEGAFHAFILDTTVHPDMRRRGIGTELVKRAAKLARDRSVEWLHVDYEPELEDFYRGCGFVSTNAGLMQLN